MYKLVGPSRKDVSSGCVRAWELPAVLRAGNVSRLSPAVVLMLLIDMSVLDCKIVLYILNFFNLPILHLASVIGKNLPILLRETKLNFSLEMDESCHFTY